MHPRNTIRRIEGVRGERAYVYGFKARAQRHHCLGYGTFAVDLQRMEELRKRYSRLVRPITYVPLFVKATALAVRQNPEANAILFRKLLGYRIVHFERVDVNLPITREVENRTITFIATIRNAADKTLREIQDELLHYERGKPDELFAIQRFQRLARMPFWLAQLVHWWMTRSPRFYVNNVGTCGLTFVEGGWYDHFFPIAPTSVVFGIGAARTEPVVREGKITVARLRKCSLMVDNYVISGLTAAQLGRDFQQLIESGEFVTDELAETNGNRCTGPTEN